MSETIPILNSILARLSSIEEKLSIKQSDTTPSNAQVEELPPKLKAFDIYLTENLDPFYSVTEKLGGDAFKAGAVVKDAWQEMRNIILLSSSCKEPSVEELRNLLAPVAAKVKEASVLISRNEWEKHTKTCSEGIQSLNWLVVKPSPCDFIESYIGGSDYWANGIRKEFRTVNPVQIAFCDTFKALIVNLVAYVKEFHRTGLSWNPKGLAVSDYKEGASTPVAVTTTTTSNAKVVTTTNASSAPPPPPKSALFSELNKDSAITSGLKKVTKDMQTWRSEYKPGDAAPVATKTTVVKPAAKAAPVRGPPKCEYQDGASKWEVENQTEASGTVTITIQDKKETVYIFSCNGSTIIIKGKCKSIVVDNCKKTKVYFDSAMASCEVVNSQRMQIHVLEAVPSVAIDKTDGIVVFLPLTSLTTEVVASKSSEMNIAWPDKDGELIERPIPEQYVHRIAGKSITANVSDLYGH